MHLPCAFFIASRHQREAVCPARRDLSNAASNLVFIEDLDLGRSSGMRSTAYTATTTGSATSESQRRQAVKHHFREAGIFSDFETEIHVELVLEVDLLFVKRPGFRLAFFAVSKL